MTDRPTDPLRHQGVVVDEEPAADGSIVRAATVFLTGSQCPWHCVMCDLWRHTTTTATPTGALPAQIEDAVASLGQAPGGLPRHVKLYNAGSFFDPRAVPDGDYDAIARGVSVFSHVVVESHPSLIGARVDAWRDACSRQAGRDGPPTHEVAMGLETAHPGALVQLQKGMTLDGFSRAADALARRGVALRAFLLVHPPFVAEAEQDDWLCRSVEYAFDAGAAVVSLIPLRVHTPAPDAGATGRAPRLGEFERAVRLALERARGRVFADVWDLSALAACPACVPARRDRLVAMNRVQRYLDPVTCGVCRESAA